MKDNKHIQKFNEHQENFNSEEFFDVRSSNLKINEMANTHKTKSGLSCSQ